MLHKQQNLALVVCKSASAIIETFILEVVASHQADMLATIYLLDFFETLHHVLKLVSSIQNNWVEAETRKNSTVR
jgi:hypothetical protein